MGQGEILEQAVGPSLPSWVTFAGPPPALANHLPGESTTLST